MTDPDHAVRGVAERDARRGAPDERRLRAIVAAHHSFVWLSLRRLGVPEGEVDDVAQGVFLRCSERLGEIEAGAERSFLFRTALGMAANAKRSVARRREIDIDAPSVAEHADGGPAPDELAELRRNRQIADEILAAMPIELSAVLILFEVEEMPTAAIATLLGIPVGTVASRLRRAREDAQARLKRLLAAQDFPGAPR